MSPSPSALGEHPAPDAGCMELEAVEALTGGGLSPPSLLSHSFHFPILPEMLRVSVPFDSTTGVYPLEEGTGSVPSLVSRFTREALVRKIQTT